MKDHLLDAALALDTIRIDPETENLPCRYMHTTATTPRRRGPCKQRQQ
jgi:hypothetical protein